MVSPSCRHRLHASVRCGSTESENPDRRFPHLNDELCTQRGLDVDMQGAPSRHSERFRRQPIARRGAGAVECRVGWPRPRMMRMDVAPHGGDAGEAAVVMPSGLARRKARHTGEASPSYPSWRSSILLIPCGKPASARTWHHCYSSDGRLTAVVPMSRGTRQVRSVPSPPATHWPCRCHDRSSD